jgi:hypothetical protein
MEYIEKGMMKNTSTTSTINQIGLRFQARDADVLQIIQDMGGVMAKRQLKALFWRNKSKRAMEKRLAKLKSYTYIDWASLEQRRVNPNPEPVVWLDWKGACYLASLSGIRVDLPEKNNENQKRTLQKNLRMGGFSWLREPRWSQLYHDLTVIDVRLTFQHYCTESALIQLEEWVNESEFRSHMDVVDIKFTTRQGKVITRKKGICPDGMLVLVDEKLRRLNQPFRARFLLEVDMATHDNLSFGWEKSLAGSAYIKSKAYRERFGNNSGRWLVITTSDIRMKHLMKQTVEKVKGDAGLFLFTSFQMIFSRNALSERIWRKCGTDQEVGLLEE